MRAMPFFVGEWTSGGDDIGAGRGSVEGNDEGFVRWLKRLRQRGTPERTEANRRPVLEL